MVMIRLFSFSKGIYWVKFNLGTPLFFLIQIRSVLF